MEPKLVTCIMPTTSERIRFLPFAIRNFLSQDYEHKELLIIDDSDGSMEVFIPKSATIIYLHVTDKFRFLGDKRNYACSRAAGEIIMHWDDDDWYASDWIRHQAQVLADNNADICGLENLRFYRPSDSKCWQYDYAYYRNPWVAGATMAYLKSAWEKQPFKALTVGEDNHFVWDTTLKVVSHSYVDGFVSILHNKNTSPKHTDDNQWKEISFQLVKDIMKEAIDDYAPFHQEPQ